MICGKSRTGKTSLAKALGQSIITLLKLLYPNQNYEVLFISEYEHLKQYDSTKHQVIIFDVIDFSSLSKQDRSIMMNHVFGSFDTPSQLRVLFGTVEIAPYTIRIFTANDIRKLIPKPDVNLLV